MGKTFNCGEIFHSSAVVDEAAGEGFTPPALPGWLVAAADEPGFLAVMAVLLAAGPGMFLIAWLGLLL